MIIDGLLMLAVTYMLFLILSGLLLMSYPQVAESLLADIDSKTWQAGLLTYVVGGVLTLAWFGGWQAGVGATPAMLLLKLRVRDRSGQDNPSLRAAVLRNSPWVLASFGNVTGNETVDVMLGVVSFAVFAGDRALDHDQFGVPGLPRSVRRHLRGSSGVITAVIAGPFI